MSVTLSDLPATINIITYQGDDWSKDFEMYDLDTDDPITVAGTDPTLTIYDTDGSILHEFTDGDGLVLTSNIIRPTLTAAQTDAMEGNYQYKLTWTYNDLFTTPIKGCITVEPKMDAV